MTEYTLKYFEFGTANIKEIRLFAYTSYSAIRIIEYNMRIGIVFSFTYPDINYWIGV